MNRRIALAPKFLNVYHCEEIAVGGRRAGTSDELRFWALMMVSHCHSIVKMTFDRDDQRHETHGQSLTGVPIEPDPTNRSCIWQEEKKRYFCGYKRN